MPTDRGRHSGARIGFRNTRDVSRCVRVGIEAAPSPCATPPDAARFPRTPPLRTSAAPKPRHPVRVEALGPMRTASTPSIRGGREARIGGLGTPSRSDRALGSRRLDGTARLPRRTGNPRPRRTLPMRLSRNGMRGTVGPRAGRWPTIDAVGRGSLVGAPSNRIRIGGRRARNSCGRLARNSCGRRARNSCGRRVRNSCGRLARKSCGRLAQSLSERCMREATRI